MHVSLTRCLLRAHFEHGWNIALLVGLIVRHTPVETPALSVSVFMLN